MLIARDAPARRPRSGNGSKRVLAQPQSQANPRDVAWMRALIDRTGAMAHARAVASGLAGAALYEFEQIFGASPSCRDALFIRSMVTWVLRARSDSHETETRMQKRILLYGATGYSGRLIAAEARRRLERAVTSADVRGRPWRRDRRRSRR